MSKKRLLQADTDSHTNKGYFKQTHKERLIQTYTQGKAASNIHLESRKAASSKHIESRKAASSRHTKKDCFKQTHKQRLLQT